MTRSRETYHCTTCGCTALQWAGRCPNCAEWNTFTATATATTATTAAMAGGPDAVPLCQIVGGDALPMATGIDEVDRVMGGGFVAGAVTLVFGPPGVGKSTLLFQVLAAVAERGFSVLLASAEESLAQVSGRATRVGDGTRAAHGPGGERCRRHRGRHHQAPTLPGRGGLRADHLRPRARRGDGEPDPDQGLRGPAHPAGQVDRGADRAGGPRHQGRRSGGTANHRAHGRHGPLVRRRSSSRAAHAHGGEAPLRADR